MERLSLILVCLFICLLPNLEVEAKNCNSNGQGNNHQGCGPTTLPTTTTTTTASTTPSQTTAAPAPTTTTAAPTTTTAAPTTTTAAPTAMAANQTATDGLIPTTSKIAGPTTVASTTVSGSSVTTTTPSQIPTMTTNPHTTTTYTTLISTISMADPTTATTTNSFPSITPPSATIMDISAEEINQKIDDLTSALMEPELLEVVEEFLITTAESQTGSTSSIEIMQSLVNASNQILSANFSSRVNVTDVKQAVSEVISSVLSSTSTPSAGNQDSAVQQLMRSAEKVIDDISGSLTQTLTDTSPPLTITTPSFSLIVAKRPPNSHENLILECNSATANISSAVTSSESVPIQIVVLEDVELLKIKSIAENQTQSDVIMIKTPGMNADLQYSISTKLKNVVRGVNRIETSQTNSTNKTDIIIGYEIIDYRAFIKVNVNLPSSDTDYSIYGALNVKPSSSDHSVFVKIVNNVMEVQTDDLASKINYNNQKGSLMLFINLASHPDANHFYIRLSADSSNRTTSRRRRSVFSDEASTDAVIYAPRVRDPITGEWVYSPDLEIDSDSNEEKVIFKSDFLGSMTSSIFVPPNKIEFDTVYDDIAAKTAENPSVLIVCCCMIGMYLILVGPLSYLDRQDYQQAKFRPVVTNHPDDTFIYQFTVNISEKSYKTFDKDLFCVLYGDHSKTKPIHLINAPKITFSAGTSHNFLLTTSRRIGPVTHLHLWTTGCKDNDSLLIDSVRVTDCQLYTSYQFEIGNWLSPTKEECYVHEIFTISTEEDRDFLLIFNNNCKNMMKDDHLWASLFTRPKNSSFTRVQRLSLCLSSLSLIMVVNAMWFRTEEEGDSDTARVELGPLVITWRAVVASVMGGLLIVPPNILIAWLFRKARRYIPYSERRRSIPSVSSQLSDSDSGNVNLFTVRPLQPQPLESYHRDFWDVDLESSRRRSNNCFEEPVRKKPLSLPWWSVIFSYSLVALCIVNGCWFCYTYSLSWGSEKSIEWLTSFCLSFLYSILIIQPIKILLTAGVFSVFLKGPEWSVGDYSQISTVSEYYNLYHSDSELRFMNEPPIVPQYMDKKTPKQIKQKTALKRRFLSKMKGVGSKVMYLILLLIIVHHNVDPEFYRQNQTLRNTFSVKTKGALGAPAQFIWMRDQIMPQIFPTQKYNGDPLSSYHQQFIDNLDGLLLGPVLLRQTKQIKNCRQSAYLTRVTAQQCFMKANTFIPNNASGYLNDSFKTSEMADELSGVISVYPKSALSANLTRENYYYIMTSLFTHNWVDEDTRYLSLEFVINNMNTQTFSQVKLLLELPAMGGILYTVDTFTFRPYPYVDTFDLIVFILQGVWVIILFYMISMEIYWCYKLKIGTYLGDFWRWAQLFNIIFASASVSALVTRSVSVVRAVEYLKNSRGEFVSFSDVLFWDDIYSFTTAIVLFISIIQILQPMDFSQQLNALKTVIKKSSETIKWYTICFILFLFGFTLFLNIYLGAVEDNWSSIWRAYYTLIVTLVGMANYGDIFPNDMFIKFMFMIFMLVGNFVILNLFLSVLNMTAEVIKESPDLQEYDQQLGDYISETMSEWMNAFNGTNKKQRTTKTRIGGMWTRERNRYFYLVEDEEDRGLGTMLQEKLERLLFLEDSQYSKSQKPKYKGGFDTLSSDLRRFSDTSGSKSSKYHFKEMMARNVRKHKLDAKLGTDHHDVRYLE